jgi:hypothetical protein
MVPLSKSGVVDSHRGFESRPLRGFCIHAGQMVRRLLLLSLMAAAALSVVSACGSLSGGLTEQQAVSKATTQAQQMSSTRVTFVSAASGHLGDFETGAVSPNPETEV